MINKHVQLIFKIIIILYLQIRKFLKIFKIILKIFKKIMNKNTNTCNNKNNSYIIKLKVCLYQ